MNFSDNPFEQATAAWQAEIDAEAARLLESGAAETPFEAMHRARAIISRRRRAAAAAAESLTKVMPRDDGPLAGGL